MVDELVSVIIPVYNAELYLEDCLNSIITQTYKNIEIIIVNDGSTDRSLNICEEFQNRSSKIILINKENEGVSVARNIGLHTAKGSWIVFLDADDFVVSTYIEELIRTALVEKADFVYCNYCTTHANKQREYEFVPLSNSNDEDWRINLLKACLSNRLVGKDGNPTNMGVPWAKLYKTELIKSVGLQFVSGLAYMEDMLFTMEYLLCCSAVAHIAKPMYMYRINPNSAMHVKKVDFEKYAKKVIEGLENLRIKYETTLNIIKKEIDYKYFLIYIQLLDLSVMPQKETIFSGGRLVKLYWMKLFYNRVGKDALEIYGTKYQKLYYSCIQSSLYTILYIIFRLRYSLSRNSN